MSAPTPKTSSSSCLSGCSAQAPAPPLEVRRERESQLEEELRRAWRRPVATTATAKDVPRLATRIEVQAWDGGASPGKKMKKEKKPHPSAKRAREQRRMSEQAESKTLSADASKNSIVQTVRALAEYFGARIDPAGDGTYQGDEPHALLATPFHLWRGGTASLPTLIALLSNGAYGESCGKWQTTTKTLAGCILTKYCGITGQYIN